MSSVPVVLSWEMVRRGLYAVPAFALLANLFPMAINAALHEPVLPLNDETRILMHVAFFPFIMVILAIGVVIAQGRISRLYAAPLSSEFLVFWHITSGAIVLAMLVAGSLALQNVLFSINQSVLGPACLTMSLWAAGFGLIHLSHKGIPRTLLLATPVIVVLWWGFARYGSWTRAPRTYWGMPTTWELIVILAAFGLNYLLHLYLVRRDRCGDFQREIVLADWLEGIPVLLRRLDPMQLRPPASPAGAMFWQFWTRRGLLLPAFAVIYATGFAALVILQTMLSDHELATTHAELPNAYLAGGLILLSAVSVLFGFVGGSLKSNRPATRELRSFADAVDIMRSEVIGNFLATRPVRDSQISRAVLKSIALSVSVGWLVYWVGFALVCGLQRLLKEASLDSQLVDVLGNDGTMLALVVVVSLLLPWLLMANTAVVVMTGRETRITLWITSIVFISIFTHSLSVWGLDSRLYELIAETTLGLIALAGTAAILLSFLVAARASQMSLRSIALSAMMWMALVLGFTICIEKPDSTVEWLLLVLAAGLVVFPLNAAPLAVAWNRHR